MAWEIDDGTVDATVTPIQPSASTSVVTFSHPVVPGGLPPGWVAEERMPSSGKAYKVYRGPNGEYAESKLQAWRLPATEALVGASVAPASHSDPPSSPVSQRLEGEQQAITPRLQRVLSATRHSPQSDAGAFTSIIQLFEPELQSPVQTRLRGVCLQLDQQWCICFASCAGGCDPRVDIYLSTLMQRWKRLNNQRLSPNGARS